ncbi:Spastin [Penicillium subrubescens]|uniref:Spastin n=2 Tax=Penicillium subrubescens TaxID=1316194 RepID=A0A1Q5UKW0_9EURO|nr:Spastin [Penicillium subrubescens]
MPQVWRSIARPCRFVARRRHPAPARQFHLSRQWLSVPTNDPQNGSTPATDLGDVVDSRQSPNSNDNVVNPDSPSTPVEQTVQPVSRPYGSAVRRAMRNRHSEQQQQQRGSTAATIPSWFRERNIVTHGTDGRQDAVQFQSQVEVRKSKAASKTDTAAQGASAPGGDGEDPSATGGSSESETRYAVAEELWDELRASVKAGLRLPPAQYAGEPPAKKSHLVLQYPGPDGILFLDAVVQRLAHELNADLVTLNAQDLTQLLSEQDLAEAGATSGIRSLGYDVYRPPVTAWPEPNEGEGEGEDDIADIAGAHGVRPEVSTPRFITIEASRDSGDIPLPNWLGLKSLVASINGQDQEPSMMRGSGQRLETRWVRLLNEVLSSAVQSTQSAQPVPKDSEEPSAPETDASKSVLSRDTIVHVQDYRDIQSSREGSRVISLLQKVIQDRRRAGSRVLLVGSTSQDLHHSPSQDGSRILQNVFDDNFSKTLVITPAMESKAVEKTFAEDQKNRTMDINIRHLQNMLRFRVNETSSTVKDDIFGDRGWPLDALTIKQSGIRDRFWSYNQVHWVATLALGSAEPNEHLSFEHIRRGIELMDRGDRVTSDWLQGKSSKQTDSSRGQSREQLLASLRKTCNSHEKKLLNGVVDAKSLRTTFADVHVPPETIDALKTLTSLSLIRPEAFTYGVLATDKIPGLLLYGPPGTGKTLLAKAVARESGATVLEVSGSEVYDMYVGEGEKNVKAIFTLAKKLSPCVVFIDEADAIFCSRTGASNRTSHRELINQFLREWDGMNDMSAFIMVATNRPFDLDDAVLRRLPRRLLVDLPTEEDRLAILKIHLKGEQLDPAVDLAELAKRTPLYSGSDLKNLSVAAALACVREENQAAVQHQGEEPYEYPVRRILTRAHFERGMEEISASISEDMSSLSAIRKFDEQYGDRKGRRQKSPGWGFIAPSTQETTADTARVRK